MYIEYCTPQPALNYVPSFSQKLAQETAGYHRPSYLIRTFDWKRVSGKEAKEGYCALSYCWEQSGKIIPIESGDYTCIDVPGHTMKTFGSIPYSDLPNGLAPNEEQNVTYEGLLKRICQDFKIRYLWYDKICINQMGKEEKQREIKQMHLIYSSACYTVAMIPEVSIASLWDLGWQKSLSKVIAGAEQKVYEQVQKSLWWKRSWTLEELMMSDNILIVGRNAHLWACKGNFWTGFAPRTTNYFIAHMLGYKYQEVKSANMVLHHAHFRTSAKEHDKIFALANILNEVVPFTIDYSCNFSTMLRSFYRQLAKQDLTVMCFGSAAGFEHQSTMASYSLPSWTGVAGLHAKYPVANTLLEPNGSHYYIDDHLRLHITCRFFTIRPTKYEENRQPKDTMDHLKMKLTSNTYYNRSIGRCYDAPGWSQWHMERFTGCNATHFCNVLSKRLRRTRKASPLSLTEDCEECIIPAVLFDVASSFFSITGLYAALDSYLSHGYVLPVLKKLTSGSQRYKAIGFILLDQYDDYGVLFRKDPHIFLNNTFNSICGDQPLKEFIIE
ncbi:hypothetical protein BJV82DRAFT_653961 [Fennellomyces sp. T-0311]|nr:hypothetical protein BJV82DRAFT_653961 [Fennellomyces sp. T-0311]